MKLQLRRKICSLVVMSLLSVFATECGRGSENPAKTWVATGTTTDVDGNVYNTIGIGKQEWMTENLKVTNYNDGSPIPLVADASVWSNETAPAYCWYDNDPAYKDVYGALYNWYVVQTDKLCPTGWSVPSNDVWETLAIYVGGKDVAGGKLKETGTAHWQSPNLGATNESGFTGLPGGHRYMNGAYYNVGLWGSWWCRDGDLDIFDATSYFWDLKNDNIGFSGFSSYWTFGYSVRCMRGIN
jgi:uncharacterized protein (TIGR02145 family)